MKFTSQTLTRGLPMHAEALLTLLSVKAAISLLPFERWRRLLHRETPSRGEPATDRGRVDDIVRAVERATKALPVDVTCLPRALSVQLMLTRRNYRSLLNVGVARGAQSQFEAHAWVEYDGYVIIGELPDLARYTKLPPWPAE